MRVTSAPAGAKILIDGQDTGYVTPDTLRPRIVPSGAHSVGVSLQGYEVPEAKVVETHLSGKLIFWSLVWPPALLVNLFKGFSATQPRALHFTLKPVGAASAPSPAAPVVAPSPDVARRRITKLGTKCAAMPLRAKEVAAQWTFIIDEVLLAELQQSGFEAIGPDDINAMLGFEKTKESVGCEEASCAAEIGNALGVDYLAAGSVAALEGAVVLTLKLIDVKNARVLARANKVAEDGQKGLPRIIAEAVQDMVGRSGL